MKPIQRPARVAAFLLGALLCLNASGARGEEPLADRLLDRGRQEMTILRIRAALADRKDIRSRYIRVQHDGNVITLAGFVKNAAQGILTEGIARRIAPAAEIRGFWSYDPDLDERDAYMTRIREQAADAEIWTRVQMAIRAPAIRALLAAADIQAVDVRHGKVRVYVIADSPKGLVDLAPHLRPIQGVVEVSQRTVRTYSDTVKEDENE